MSAAAIRTTKPPSVGRAGRPRWPARGPGRWRRRRPCRPATARRAACPGRGSRSAQPNRRAPSRRQATRLRAERQAALRVGGRLVADPQLDRVDAGRPPPARPWPTPARTSPAPRPARASRPARARPARPAGGWCAWPGAAYMTRVQTAVCSANSVRIAVCSTTSCVDGGQPPSASRRAAPAGWSACGSRSARTSAGGSARPSPGGRPPGPPAPPGSRAAGSCPWTRSRRRRAAR